MSCQGSSCGHSEMTRYLNAASAKEMSALEGAYPTIQRSGCVSHREAAAGPANSQVLCVVCGVWCVVCGVWCVVCGVWCVVCGVWCVVCVLVWARRLPAVEADGALRCRLWQLLHHMVCNRDERGHTTICGGNGHTWCSTLAFLCDFLWSCWKTSSSLASNRRSINLAVSCRRFWPAKQPTARPSSIEYRLSGSRWSPLESGDAGTRIVGVPAMDSESRGGGVLATKPAAVVVVVVVDVVCEEQGEEDWERGRPSNSRKSRSRAEAPPGATPVSMLQSRELCVLLLAQSW